MGIQGELKMKCKCGNEMILTETCKRGRWVRGYYHCEKCGENKSEKLRLIPYKRPKGTLAKGCSVPWGKSKHTRFNPRKKKRR